MGRIVFCRSGDAPSLEELFDWARADGIALSVDLPPRHDQPRWDPPFSNRQGIAHVDGIGFYVEDELILDTLTPREKRRQADGFLRLQP
jgi:hypothetical protein